MIDESVGAEEDLSFVVEDDLDWDLRSLLFKEEEEEVGEKQRTDPEIYAKDGCEAFWLKLWLKSVLAAAALSIFIVGGGRMQFTGSNERIPDAAYKNEEVKVAASSSSLIPM